MQNKKMLALEAVLISIVSTVGIVTLTVAPMVQQATAATDGPSIEQVRGACVSGGNSNFVQTPSGRFNSHQNSHFNCGLTGSP